jgi:hypothetical protein
MLKKTISATVLIIAGFTTFSQQTDIDTLSLPPIFEYSYEISSICMAHGKFYLPSEKCKVIFVADIKNPKNYEIIDLSHEPLFKSKIEIEGAALYKNHLFMVDEAQSKVFNYNSESKTLDSIETQKTDFKKCQNREYGLEGIAVDSVNNKVYILREKNAKSQSEIYVFKINENNNKISFEQTKKFYIQHSDINWRYSDLFFDQNIKKILCLKSYYNENDSCIENKFQIDTLSDCVKNNSVIKGDEKKFKNLDIDVCHFKSKNYSTNLEGICVYKENFYIVSDNHQGRAKCEFKDKKTLLFKMPYSENQNTKEIHSNKTGKLKKPRGK